MDTNDLLPARLRSHRQLHGASCAVSAFESVAKLHGLISADSFPLQSDPVNQHLGFGDRSFLAKFDILATDEHYDTATALAVLKTETQAGRFPLISLLGRTEDGKLGYHVYLCADIAGELALVDPAKPKIIVCGTSTVSTVLEQNRASNPERTTLHIMTYRVEPGSRVSPADV